jgi:hypothetical protein
MGAISTRPLGLRKEPARRCYPWLHPSDHCLTGGLRPEVRAKLVAGPSVKGGGVGKHPSLADLDAGDLKFHTDFRAVYATQLDAWLGCDSKAVLGAPWDHVEELEPRA